MPDQGESDFSTESLLVKGYERYNFHVSSNRALYASFAQTQEIYAANILNNTALPTVSLPVAVAMGAAAVLIQNPDISRRGLFSWGGE